MNYHERISAQVIRPNVGLRLRLSTNLQRQFAQPAGYPCFVIPAKAGIQGCFLDPMCLFSRRWIPACAGMTIFLAFLNAEWNEHAAPLPG